MTLGLGCTPLEERVEIFDVEWCDDERTIPATCVIDGDTFDLASCAETQSADVERVRLLGVDAPEVAHGDEAAECFGEEASEFLYSVLQGRSVRLEFDTECEGTFGRTLAWVFIEVEPDDALSEELERLGDLGLQEDGSYSVLLNELVVRAGYAELYTDIGDGRYDRRLIDAAQQAAFTDEGLWGFCDG